MRLLDHPAQLLIILAIVVLLFGGKKLPEAARGLGRSLRIFKSEVKEMQDEDQRPAPAKAPEPIEGRVVDGDAPRAATPTDQRHDV